MKLAGSMMPFDVRTVLKQFSTAYQPEHVISIDAAGFSGAVITKLQSPAGEFSLRGWPRGGMPRARLLGLHRLTSTVYDQGIAQVPVPVPALDGCTLVESQARYWQLEPWMPGQADYWRQPDRQRLHAAVNCLAAWHRAAARFVAQKAEQKWFESKTSAVSPAVTERLQRLQHFHRERCELIRRRLIGQPSAVPGDLAASILDLFQHVTGRIGLELRVLRKLRFQLQPCIRDIWHDHVLYTGDDVTGLIDLGACRVENVVTDLARLLGSLLGDDQPAWRDALQVYQHQRRLTPGELQLLRTLDRSATVLAGMVWLERLYIEQRQFPDLDRVVERMSRIQERLQILAGD